MAEDEIKMNVNINLTDKNGQPLNVEVQKPEILTETFDLQNDYNIKKEGE